MKLRSLLPALLFLAIPLNLAAQTTPVVSCEQISKTYAVADLVIPVPDFDRPSCVTASGGATCRAVSVRRLDSELIRLIQTTVAPTSWREVGGNGSVEFFETSMALVVLNTPEVQEQVEEFLGSLRKAQDTTVVIEVRLINVTGTAFDKLAHAPYCEEARQKECAAQWFQHRCVALGETEVGKLLADLQADPNTSVLMTPKCSVFDGQKAFIKIDGDGTKLSWKMQPRISADRQFTALGLTLEINDQAHETVLCVPSGGYCLIGGLSMSRTEFGPPVLSKVPYVNRLFKNVGYSHQHWVALVKVSPLCGPGTEIKGGGSVLARAASGLKSAPITGEEAASAPTATATAMPSPELMQLYLDACSRGNLRLIKKYHRELQKQAIEKQLTAFDAKWLQALKLQPRTDVTTERAVAEPCCEIVPSWEVRWLGKLCEGECPLTAAKPLAFELEFSFGCRIDEHTKWNSRWLPITTEWKATAIQSEEEAGWAKPGPRTIQRIGIDQK